MVAELEAMQAQIDQLRADLNSPHAQAIREFEADHKRRAAETMRQEAEQAKRDALIAPSQWLKVTCKPSLQALDGTDRQSGIVRWTEMDMVPTIITRQISGGIDRFGADDCEEFGAPEPKERPHSMVRSGHAFVVQTDLSDRIKRSTTCTERPTLADLIDTGDLIIDTLSPDECRATDKRVRIMSERAQLIENFDVMSGLLF